MRLLSTLLKPNSGTTTVAGHDLLREPQKVRASIGVLPEDTGLYDRLTPREHLLYYGRPHRMPEDVLKKRGDERDAGIPVRLRLHGHRIGSRDQDIQQRKSNGTLLTLDLEGSNLAPSALQGCQHDRTTCLVMDTHAMQIIKCLLFNSHVKFDRHVSVQACLRRLAAVIMPSPYSSPRFSRLHSYGFSRVRCSAQGATSDLVKIDTLV
jgi:hypothetical protein